MLKRCKFPQISEEDEERVELAMWAWDSHYWVEYGPGYAKCKYCEKIYTSEMGIGGDYPLCPNNPILVSRGLKPCHGTEET